MRSHFGTFPRAEIGNPYDLVAARCLQSGSRFKAMNATAALSPIHAAAVLAVSPVSSPGRQGRVDDRAGNRMFFREFTTIGLSSVVSAHARTSCLPHLITSGRRRVRLLIRGLLHEIDVLHMLSA